MDNNNNNNNSNNSNNNNNNNDNDLFRKHDDNANIIVLVDASGSVRSSFYGITDKPSVFDKIREVVEKIPGDEFRMIFWNSNANKDSPHLEFFKDGVFKIPYVVKRASLKQTFDYVNDKIVGSCSYLSAPGI